MLKLRSLLLSLIFIPGVFWANYDYISAYITINQCNLEIGNLDQPSDDPNKVKLIIKENHCDITSLTGEIEAKFVINNDKIMLIAPYPTETVGDNNPNRMTLVAPVRKVSSTYEILSSRNNPELLYGFYTDQKRYEVQTGTLAVR